MSERLRMAYADPPYIGQAHYHYREHPDYRGEVDHAALIEALVVGYPDGWALSASSPSIPAICGLLAEHELAYRIAAWVKPFAAYKRNIRVAYAWEPVFFVPARRLEGAAVSRDFIAEGITLKRGLAGAKPEKFCFWLFEVMGLRPGDTLDDLYPGSGAVTAAWERWSGRPSMAGQMTLELKETAA